jgi:hypothetical protein
MKWTEEILRDEMMKFSSRGQLFEFNPKVYKAARRRFAHLFDEIYGDLFRWDENSIRQEMLKYSTRSEFNKRSSGAAAAARSRFPHLVKEISSTRTSWNYESLRAKLSEFSSREELLENDPKVLDTAYRKYPELLEEFYGKPFRYTKEILRDLMKNYSSRSEFSKSYGGGYAHCHKNCPELLDEFYPGYKNGHNNDVIYIWRAVGQFFNGNPVYKIGVTSSSKGMWRIEQVSKKSGFKYDLICCEKVIGKASDIERKLHTLGEDPRYLDINGRTEFRALTDSALYVAISIICGSL